MIVLGASLLALLVGPVLVGALGGGRRSLAAVDGFVLVAVIGLVVLHLLPHSVELGGWWAVGAGIAGLFLPMLAERTFVPGRPATTGHRVVTAVALVGLAVHAFLDGAALATHEVGHAHGHDGGDLLVAGVVLHRLPIGIAVWGLVRPHRGRGPAAALLAFIAAATAAGFGVGGVGMTDLPLTALAVVQALVAGSLVHVVFDHPIGAEPGERSPSPVAGSVGAALAVGLLAALGGSHSGGVEHTGGLEAVQALAILVRVSAPALLAAVLAASLWRGLVPTDRRRPLWDTLLVPLAFALALLGPAFAAAWLVTIAARALFARRLLGSLPGPATLLEPREPPGADAEPSGRRVLAALRDLFDAAGPWIAAGILVAAAGEQLVAPEWLGTFPPTVTIPALALLGLPLRVAAPGAVPLIAILVHKGLSPGAGLAFLLTCGPMGPPRHSRVGLRFGVALPVLATGVGFVADRLLPASLAPPLHGIAETGAGALQIAATAGLGLLFLGALVRLGPRALVDEVLPGIAPSHGPPGAHAHDHADAPSPLPTP
ncbi:MAG: hypothetical protein ACQEXJ_17535 [Myxococcota bacterium]